MGIAAYNRGSAAIARPLRESRQNADQAYFSTHTLPEVKKPLPPIQGPQQEPGCQLGYLTVDRVRTPEIGDRVYCTVSACRGWSIVTAVKGAGRDVRLKTDATGRTWGYPHNFTYCPPTWMK